MNNKAFTLVEVLGVIVILMAIFAITVPIVNDAIKQSKDTVYQNQINTILTASYDWSLENSSSLPPKGNSVSITLAQLKQANLVDVDIKNPKTKKLYPNDLVISIRNIKDETVEESSTSKIGGDYLYTIDLNSGTDAEYNEKAPIIVLNGDSVTYLNMNQSFTEPGYNATSYDGTNLTSNVIRQVEKDGNVLYTLSHGMSDPSYVSTTELAIYSIHYTVVDSIGNSTTVIRTIIITDLEPPQLTIPDNTTILSTITSFDLLDGVSCTDNSGSCSINSSGNITLGVPGKYVITYSSTDQFGNTSYKKRVITIKNN